MLKKPLTYEEQIRKLEAHGIIVEDKETALRVLLKVGYYRLTGYAIQFRRDPGRSECAEGTTFKQIYNLYCFDESLRQILRFYLEKVEFYYKTLIAHNFALSKCIDPPHNQHYDSRNYYNKHGFDTIIKGFSDREASYYKDSLIIQHHKSKYSGKMPLWVLLELMSFSGASMFYSAMYCSDQEKIAENVGISRKTLGNHLHCLSVLRNKCAHGARLYNTVLNPPVRLSKTFLIRHPEIRNDTVFAYVLVLLRRLPEPKEKEEFKNALVTLINGFSGLIDYDRIGFPKNYETILGNNIV